MDLQLEIEIFKRFLQKEKVERFLWMLESPQRRQRIFDDLRDVRYFDMKMCQELTGQDKMPLVIIERLKTLGVKDTIYTISSDEEYDGTSQALEPLINEKLSHIEEVIGYCRKSKVGFFKNHEDWFYLLSKNADASFDWIK